MPTESRSLRGFAATRAQLAVPRFMRAADLIEAAADEQPPLREALGHASHIALDGHGRLLSLAPAVAARIGGHISLVGKRLIHRILGVERANAASRLVALRDSRSFESLHTTFRRPDGAHVRSELSRLGLFDLPRGGLILVCAAWLEDIEALA